MTKLIPGGAPGLAQLTDDELLANTRRLVGKSNQLLAALLVHLAEVETRGVHRTRRCASLYTYCIYELRFSEDAAARRSAAARFVKEFPALFDAVADGELHLTGLLMIGPHLTPENHAEVLGRAKFRTKKELTKLVRELNPLPQLPDRIEPLGPSLALAPRRPTWAEFAASLCPPIRELPAGERPRDWANDGSGRTHGDETPETDGRALGAGDEAIRACNEALRPRETLPTDDESLPVGPVPADLPPISGPQHYQLQFGTSEEHVQLIERARALLARERPGATLGELHLEAMRMFVAALETKKFAATGRPRKPNAQSTRLEGGEPPELTLVGAELSEPPRQHRQRGALEPSEPSEAPRRRGAPDRPEPAGAPRHGADAVVDRPKLTEPPRQRGRYIPAAARREVYRRDGGRCSYVDERGERCCETRYLELHHLQPFARQGAHVASNLALRCRAHNALAAEQDFGPAVMAQKREALRHEALAAQVDSYAKR
ncbi:MAG TPA: HNH endonuclease signature motif containing protein [Polyangiaceae bacterium]|nr:HNH endonuclease signature motif containing protein [Polyangiaceae bacterium]